MFYLCGRLRQETRESVQVLASNMDLLIVCSPAYQAGERERENTQVADQIIIIQ